jgi:hypothetical protein
MPSIEIITPTKDDFEYVLRANNQGKYSFNEEGFARKFGETNIWEVPFIAISGLQAQNFDGSDLPNIINPHVSTSISLEIDRVIICDEAWKVLNELFIPIVAGYRVFSPKSQFVRSSLRGLAGEYQAILDPESYANEHLEIEAEFGARIIKSILYSRRWKSSSTILLPF